MSFLFSWSSSMIPLIQTLLYTIAHWLSKIRTHTNSWLAKWWCPWPMDCAQWDDRKLIASFQQDQNFLVVEGRKKKKGFLCRHQVAIHISPSRPPSSLAAPLLLVDWLTRVCHIWQGQSTSILTSLLVQIAAWGSSLDPPPPPRSNLHYQISRSEMIRST